MENRKGSGVFLGVVSIATLVVAIIGATFAFFSATVTGEGSVDVGAYEFNASLSVNAVYTADKIIPMDPTKEITGYTGDKGNNTNLKYAINEAATRCQDSQGMDVCAVYSATFQNNGSEDITLNGVLKSTKNQASSEEMGTDGQPLRTGFTNLKLVQLTGEEGSFGVDTSAAKTMPDLNGEIELDQVVVPATESKTVYFVVYLNEAGATNNKEMGAQYSAELTYTADGASAELTGTFNLSAEPAE